MTGRLLPLANMAQRHGGLTPALAESYLEAARVCLDRHHSPPQEFSLHDGSTESEALVEWEPTDERCKNAWANISDATRDGAYACALAAAEIVWGLVAVRRAETRTGADYYVGSAGQPAEDLENCLRLEVSGTDLDRAEVRSRLRDKIVQVLAGDSNLPALAAVVGFRARLIMLKAVEEKT